MGEQAPEASPQDGVRSQVSGRFSTTQWTLVCAARDRDDPASAAALERLCETYWYPLYAYVRRRGYSAVDAKDLTQAFFHRLLSKDFLQKADPAKGKFRTFLLLSMKRFLANEWHREGALKRGGGQVLIPIDQGWAESTYHHEPIDDVTPEILYERRWALLLLGQALDSVEEEMDCRGRKALFEALKDTLTGGSPSTGYAEIGKQLDMTEDAVKTAAYRMRLRLRNHLCMAIMETVRTQEEVEEEIRYLFTVFS